VRDVFFLTSGWFNVPAAAVNPLAGVPGFHTFRLSNAVAVIARDNGEVALVDCGWSREECAAPGRTIGRMQARLLGMQVKRGDAIVDQLASVGIAADRVRTVIATHLHLDHVGGVCDFPNAELVCSDVELSAARVRPAGNGYRPADIEMARVRPVNLSAGPSYGFPASLDLFGDGEVVLLDAHGHTPGLVAVAIRGRESGADGRCYVHVGDAAYQAWEWGLAPAGPCAISRMTAWRMDLLRLRYASLRDCEADPRRPILVPSHDATIYAQLPHAPEERRAGSAA
jgi:glyoxylase-like metal-dependent hydrolase (beta-lactamase superfamily II)